MEEMVVLLLVVGWRVGLGERVRLAKATAASVPQPITTCPACFPISGERGVVARLFFRRKAGRHSVGRRCVGAALPWQVGHCHARGEVEAFRLVVLRQVLYLTTSCSRHGPVGTLIHIGSMIILRDDC